MRKQLFTVLLTAAVLPATSQLTDAEIIDRKMGRLQPDSTYVYSLPYQSGKRFLFIQGANSKMSHRNELSFDFKMKTGSGICAVRDGVVIGVKEDSNKGGLKDEFLSEGNHIVVRHEDGSVAQYWHLEMNGVLVEIGDSVKQNQVIGRSGNTGYTAFPHLHFQLLDPAGKETLPRFNTKKGTVYLRPGKWYKK
ncbi:MAG: M23 family metallopeptidase [Chitinophagaceae bacterium]|nr:MAG: M23 family metallopeptidase [Chitinophagaceae bacterium]